MKAHKRRVFLDRKTFERRDPPDLFRRYFGLEEDLERLFGRKVDLVVEGACREDLYFGGRE